MPSQLPPMLSVTDELVFEEGCKLAPYRDSLGRWAIGIGCDMAAQGLLNKDGTPSIKSCSIEWAFNRLSKNIEEASAVLHLRCPWVINLDEVRARVLFNMCFHMGWGNGERGLSSFKNTLRYVREGNWTKASEGILSSRYAKQTPARATRMAYRMKTGKYWMPGNLKDQGYKA